RWPLGTQTRDGDVGAYVVVVGFFFFSSRRRHTRSTRDWSSDVCSSDLVQANGLVTSSVAVPRTSTGSVTVAPETGALKATVGGRSEERRVGKEGRSRWAA